MPTSRAVYDLVGSNIEKNVIDRITAYLRNHGGKATAKEIMKNVKIKKVDFDDYLDTMVEAEMVKTEMVRHAGKAGRPSLWVFLIEQPDLVDSVYNVNKVDFVDIVAPINCIEESETKSTKSTKSINSTQSSNPIGEKTSPMADRLCAKCHKHMGMSATLPGLGEVCLDCLEGGV